MQTLGNNPLLEDAVHPDLTRILQGRSSELARATRPAFLPDRDSPVEWERGDWEEMEAKRYELLDMEAVRSQFDRERFLSDGYAIFRGVMRPRAVVEWREALRRGQQINDALLQGDWAKIDWRGLGRRPPDERLTASEIARALGGSQKTPQKTDIAGVRTLRVHSVFAEYFPAGHVPFLMNVITHPQMLQLQRICLGRDEVYFDHNQLLNRPAGYAGGPWHSHRLHDNNDQSGVATIEEYDAQANFNLTLCYPDGFEEADDGGLNIIRGSHLFRDSEGCRGETDEEIESSWLRGRRHPVTSEPLKIERLSLPPGSIACCLSHAAHAVSRKAMERETRWCLLICYRVADATGQVWPPLSVPPVWAMKAQRGELPDVLTQLLRPSFDRELAAMPLVR